MLATEPPPADRAVYFAEQVGGILERKHAGRVQPGELLGPAWEGAARFPDHPLIAAWNQCIDYLRRRDGRPGRGVTTVKRSVFCCSQSREARAGLADLCQPADDRPSLLGLWVDGLPVRRAEGWTWRERVWVYLFAVEGLRHADIAAMWGVAPSRVSQVVGGRMPPFFARSMASTRSAMTAAKGGP